MQYMGSKARIANRILPIILKNRKPGQYYVEPFAGGMNTIDSVPNPRIAGDCHFYLIELFKNLVDGWIPPMHVTEEEYLKISQNRDEYPPRLVGYVGFCSYGGKWFGGYRRDSAGKRDYWKEHYDALAIQTRMLLGTKFVFSDFMGLEIPSNSIVYCDPPYTNTTRYSMGWDSRSSIDFWNWVRRRVVNGHTLFVSEYKAPSDFESVWNSHQVSSLTKNTGSKTAVEHLFVHKSQLIHH